MSVNTYSGSSNINLSPHFNVAEFKCKCGDNHPTKVDSELIDKLEKLRTLLRCSKIIVNSGYRCSKHDRNVGGNGIGMHTKGHAADIVCYGEDGKIISSKIVSCACQDIGFPAIANIDNTYTATHVDTRPAGKWYGDEVETTASSATDDFWKYYAKDVKRSDVYGEEVNTKTINVKMEVDGVKYEGTLTETK